jgi:gliding motility-associated-like protein
MRWLLLIALNLLTILGFPQNHKVNLCFDNQFEFTYTVESSEPNTIFYWYLDDVIQFGQDLVIDWKDLTPGYHTISVYGITEGCQSETLYYKILVEECSTIYIPNAFTPDGWGINDTWYPIGIGWEWIEVSVYSKWGMLVFHSTELDGYWDGAFRGGDYYVQNDVYVYKVTWKGTNREPEVIYGHVVVLR